MIPCRWLGRVAYRDALAAQRDWRERVLADEAEEQLWLLEHDPVVTLGRRGGEVDRAALAARGVDVVETERGGLATWHGPGQLVGYPLIHLDRRRWRVVDAVAGLERGVITWLATRGVAATQRPDAHGVWVGDAKIAAIGLHVRRGVTMHGFALNLALGPEAFAGIVPCGLAGLGVTSLHALTGARVSPEDAALEVGAAVLHEISEAHR